MIKKDKSHVSKWHSGLKGKLWSSREIAYLIEHGNSKPLMDLSAELERSYHSVKGMRHKLGLGKRKSYRFWTKQEIDFSNVMQGRWYAEISRKIWGVVCNL